MGNIKFIGTGSGKTSLKRFHSSFLISTVDYNLLVDAGDGVSKALLAQNVDYNSINGILFSHLHPDHYTGLAALIVQMKMQNRKVKLDIYVHKNLSNTLESFLINSYLFPEGMGFEITYHQFDDDKNFAVGKNIQIRSRQNSHLKNASNLPGYKDKSFSCSSFLFNINGNMIHYTGDIGCADDLLLFKEFDSNYLITEVTHIQFGELLEIIGREISPEKIILTHLSDGDNMLFEEKIKTLSMELSEKFIIAFDGMTFDI